MNRDQIKLSQLRALIAVAETGNFGEAGLRLGISQSAVSHAIATLETEMGVVLFARGRHGAQLTAVGDRILNHAQGMMQLLEEIERDAQHARGLQGGDVRLGAFRSFASHVLPHVIAQFRDRFPAINFSITEYPGDNGAEQALRKGKVDISVIYLPPPPDLIVTDLFRDEYVVLFPQNADVPAQISWDDLYRFPLIFPVETDYCAVLIRRHFAAMQKPLRPAYHIREDSTTVGMVRQGLGISVMARLAAQPLPPDLQVRSLPVPLERVVRVAVMPKALHPPAVYAFLEALKTFDYSEVVQMPSSAMGSVS